MFLPLFNYYSGKQLAFNYSNYQTYLILAGIGLFTAILAGGYPAFFLASFKPTTVLKKNLSNRSCGGISRKILVVIQFSFAIILIITLIYLYHQIDFLKNSDPGFDDENIVFTHLKGDIHYKFEEVRNKLLQHPHIENVTAAYNLPNSNSYYTAIRAADDPENTSHAVWDVVDFEYLQTFKLRLMQGRFFSRQYITDQHEAIVINDAMAKALQFTEPIGQSLILWDKHYTIIGVLNNFHNRPLVYPIEPMVLILGKSDYNIMFARIGSNDKNTITSTMNDIKQVCNQFSPDYPLEYHSLKGFPLEGTDDMQAVARVLLGFTILGIGISCLGLYGLSLFLVGQRKKEVGIRKVLGGSAIGIVGLFSKEYVLLLLIANIIASPISYLVINRVILSTYRVGLSIWIFIITGTVVLLLALLTVGSHALRTAVANPVEALRYE